MQLNDRSMAAMLTFAAILAVVPSAAVSSSLAQGTSAADVTSAPRDDAAGPIPAAQPPVSSDPRTSPVKAKEALLEEKLEQIRKLQDEVKALRAATPTDRPVMVRVKIMELQVTKMKQLGIALEISDGIVVDQITDALPGKAGLFKSLLAALQANGLIKVLAEPSLVTVSGRPASVQSGSKVPVAVPRDQGEAVIENRQVGTRLDCLAVVLDSGRIRLELRPVISEIDPSRSVQIQDTLVPGLRTRWVDTAIELDAGQTVVLSGLVQARSAAPAAVEETALLVSVKADFVEPVAPAEEKTEPGRR